MNLKPLKIILVAIMCCFQSPAHSLDNISRSVEQLAISSTIYLVSFGLEAARGFVDLQYSDIFYEKRFDRLSINNLKIIPPKTLVEEGCEIKIKSIKIFSAEFPDVKQKFSISDFNASALCIPYEQRALLALAGIRSINIPMIYFDLSYEPASGGLNLSLSTEIQGLLRVNLSIDTDHFSYNFLEEELKIRLKQAEITLENLGAWENVRDQIPPSFVTPGTSGANISRSIGQLIDGTGVVNSNAKDVFLRSLESTWDQFLIEQDTIAFRTNFRPESPRNLRIYDYSRDISFALDDFQPIFGNKNLAREQIRPLDDVAWLINENEASGAQKLRTAKALISGSGVPQNLALGVKILRSLATLEDGDSFSVLARHLSISEPEEAYKYALKGAALGNAVSASIALELEEELPLMLVLKIQDDLGTVQINSVKPNNVINYSQLAEAYYTGTDRLKSYKSAYLYANLSAASGNITAKSIRDDILGMSKNERPSVRAQWQKALTEIANETLTFWISEKLGEKLSK